MKIQLVSSKYQPEYSGSGLRAHRTHQRLREKYGVETEVICSGTESTDSAVYELDGFSVTRILSSKLRKIQWALGKGPLKRILNAIVTHREARQITAVLRKRQFDLLHVFGYAPATIAAIRWARKHNVPIMIELVNMVNSPYQYLPGTSRFSKYDLGKQTVIVAISKELGQISERAGLSENIWVRPNPVDTARFSPVGTNTKNAQKKRLFDIAPDIHLVLYVAKFIERKNHSFLIDVLSYLPSNFKLVLAGPPLPDIHSVPGLTREQIPSLIRKAEDLTVSDRLIVRPEFVDFSKYVQAADVTCFPSEREGMGTPLLESLSAGVPVVANAGESTFRDHLIDGQNGYLEPLDAKRWAEAIIKATAISADQRKLFAKDTSDRYSTDRIDYNYFRLIKALINSEPEDKIRVNQVLNT